MATTTRRRKRATTVSVKSDILRNWATIILSGLGILGVGYTVSQAAWSATITPKIDAQIECKMKPVVSELKEVQKGQEYHTYLFMSTLTDSQIQWANQRYTASRRSMGEFESRNEFK